MIRHRSFTLLALALALLVPGSLSAKVEPASRSFEIAPPSEISPYSYYIAHHVETSAISLGSQGFIVGWVTAESIGRDGSWTTSAAWLRPDGTRAQFFDFLTLTDEGGWVEDLGLASLGEGRFVSVACSLAYPSYIVTYRRLAVGQDPLDSEPVLLAGSWGPPSHYMPRIASNGKGLFVIAWAQSDSPYEALFQIVAQVYDSDGQPMSPEIVVSTSQLAPSFDGGIAVGMDADGNFVVLWTDLSAPQHPIWGRRFDRVGNPLGKRFGIGNQGRNWTDVTWESWLLGEVAMAMAPSGEFVVAWRDSAKPGFMLLSRFTADGRRKPPITWLPYDGADPAIALDSSGRVALFWMGSLPALAVFDASLRPLGPVVFGTPTGMGGDYTPMHVGVAFGDDGRILTTWIGRRGNRTRGSVLGRFWRVR